MNAVLASERRDRLCQAALAQRNALSGPDAQRWSAQIQDRALALTCYSTAQAVALYSPIHHEVDTDRLLDHALASGKKVFLPRWDGHQFTFARIARRGELVPGRFGIMEPSGALGLTDADKQRLLVLVPGLVFDGCGNRLGRGGGNYDRLLEQVRGSATAVGLAYEFQIAAAVPARSWDFAMHFIVTEVRTIDCQMALRQTSAAVDGELRRGVL